MIDRPGYLQQIRFQFDVHPVVTILGPRQCGKTTLAGMYADRLVNEEEIGAAWRKAYISTFLERDSFIQNSDPLGRGLHWKRSFDGMAQTLENVIFGLHTVVRN